MSYMRGPCYVWRDDERVHVWAEEGYDGWDDTSWAEGRTGSHVPGSMTDGASGIGLREEIADAYVMMGWPSWFANSALVPSSSPRSRTLAATADVWHSRDWPRRSSRTLPCVFDRGVL